MLRYLYATELDRFPRLSNSMFRDRAKQFAERLKWDVHVDKNGHERDEYDDMNPLYVIWEGPDGRHGGSMRFLPTTSACMVNDHFLDLTDKVRIESPLIWECTRFCLSPDSKGSRVSAALALGAGELMQAFKLRHYIGVFDTRMQRIYRLMGLRPEVIGSQGEGRDAIGVGLWSMDESMFAPVLARVGVTRAISKGWLRYSLSNSKEQHLPDAAIA